MKYVKLFEQFILNDNIISDIKKLSSKIEEHEILNELNLDEIIIYSTLDNSNKNLNEGLLSKLRDKIKELTSKKSDISGEGSRDKKQKFQAAIDTVKDKLEDVKQKHADEKKKLEDSGYVKTDEDTWADASDNNWPDTKEIKDSDGNEHYYIESKEKIKKDYENAVKKFKESGLFKWGGKSGQDPKIEGFPDKSIYDVIEPLTTPTGKAVFYVKRKKKNIDDKIKDIENKITELDDRFEDDHNGDASSDFYYDTYEPTKGKLLSQLDTLKKQKEN